MKAHVEILGPGSADSSSSIRLFFDQARYQFECGDGTQRLCVERSIKHSLLRGLYLTSLGAPSVGGLLGFFLTVADAGKKSLSIGGPEGLKRLFYNARDFCRRPNVELTLQEIDLEAKQSAIPITVQEDENVTIQAVPVKCRRDMEVDISFGAHYDCISYICRLRDIRGKFNRAQAVALGVPVGRLFGVLQKGNNVTLDDGTVIKPADVMSPSVRGPVIIIVACPTIDHVQSVVSARSLDPVELGILNEAENREAQRAAVVFHLAPKRVLETSPYQEWCDSFGETVTHIPLHATVTPPRTVFRTQVETLALLHHTLDKDLFPLPADAYEPCSPRSAREARAQEKEAPRLVNISTVSVQLPQQETRGWLPPGRVGKWVDSDFRLKFILSPPQHIGLNREDVLPRFVELKPSLPIRPWRNVSSPFAGEPVPEGEESVTPACISSLTPKTVAIRFFGTAAALPGSYRNVSAVMLDMFELGGVLLDCGEGTWGQMVRHFGYERAQRVLCGLKVVFISHMHADHHLGLLMLLHERTMAMKTREELQGGPQLTIVGPRILSFWLEAFQDAAKVPLRNRTRVQERSYRFFDAASMKEQVVGTSVFKDSLGIDIVCVPVDHCPLSYGVVIYERTRQWKVVYSGDTRPCPALAKAGEGATLAIHEATFEDGLSEEAAEKLHCTTTEALQICAVEMKAWRTILTHFSQRYPKVPRLDEEVLQKLANSRAATAFDLMCIDFTRLEDLPRIMPALKDTFPDSDDEAFDLPIRSLEST